jgi:prevent-host-death family protein
MIELSTSEARQDMAKVLAGVKRGERFLLNRHGKAVAAIVSAEDLEFLQAIEDRSDARAARAALADAEVNGTIPWEQVKANLGL